MVSPINTFTIHNLIGFMITASLAAMFYIVYLKAGRRKMDLIAANFIFSFGATCLTSFLTDNLVPAGMSAYGWPGGPTAEALRDSTLQIHRFAWVFGILIIPTQLHFVLCYCNKRNFLRRHIGVLYVIAALLVPCVWTPLWVFAPDVPLSETSSWGSTIPWLPNMGPAAYVNMLCIFCIQIFSLVQMWKTRRISVSGTDESLGGRRIVFVAFLIQLTSSLADLYTNTMSIPIIAVIPIGSGGAGILLSIALVRSRMEADRARYQLQAEKAAMLECVPQPLVYFGTDARLQWANGTAAAFAGKKPDELAGSSLSEIVRSTGKNRLAIETAWQKGQLVTGEIVREDNSTWIVNANPVMGKAGKPVGAVMLATDITEIRQAQESLRDSNINILNAREEECRRVAGDLHDSVAQGLASLQMQFSTLMVKAAEDTPDRKEFESAAKRCRDLGKEVRQISHQLYPPALDLLGLNAALDEVLSPYRSAGIECTIDCQEQMRATRLSQGAEVAIYRIAQEAVNNAVRHGKARKINIQLEMTADEVQLTVTDDGIGFETGKKAKGLGMTSMTSRISGVGGTLDVSSRPGRTSVKAIVPMAKARREAPAPAAQMA